MTEFGDYSAGLNWTCHFLCARGMFDSIPDLLRQIALGEDSD